MGFRKGAYFYDQFLTTPPLASKLADGGGLLEDYGMIAFGMHHAHMKKAIEYWEKKRSYGLGRFLTNADLDPEEAAYGKTLKEIDTQASNDATYVISDHRVIWMQLKAW